MKIPKSIKRKILNFPDYDQHFIVYEDYPITELHRFCKKPYFQRDIYPHQLKKITKAIIDEKMANNVYWFWEDKRGNIKSLDGQHRLESYIYLNSLDPAKYKTISFQAILIETDSKQKAIEIYRNSHKLKKHNLLDDLKILDTGYNKFFKILGPLCGCQPYNNYFNYSTPYNLIKSARSYIEKGHLRSRASKGNLGDVETILTTFKKNEIDRVLVFLSALKEFPFQDNFKKKSIFPYIYVIFYYNDFDYKKSKLFLSKLKNNNELSSFIKNNSISSKTSSDLLKLIEKIIFSK